MAIVRDDVHGNIIEITAEVQYDAVIVANKGVLGQRVAIAVRQVDAIPLVMRDAVVRDRVAVTNEEDAVEVPSDGVMVDGIVASTEIQPETVPGERGF